MDELQWLRDRRKYGIFCMETRYLGDNVKKGDRCLYPTEGNYIECEVIGQTPDGKYTIMQSLDGIGKINVAVITWERG